MRETLGGILGRIPITSPAMGVALLALIIAASGAAVAAIPSNGTITACYAKNTGALRVIDTGQMCSSKETQLAWKDGSTLLGKNEKAADSDKLDNNDSTEFLGANQTAADSNKLDGLNSTDFTQGSGTVVIPGRLSQTFNTDPFIPRGAHPNLFDSSQTQQLGFSLNYTCPSVNEPMGDAGFLFLDDQTFAPGGLHYLEDNGSGNPVYTVVPRGEEAPRILTNPTGDHTTLHVMQGASSGVVTVEVFTLTRANDCYARAIALVTPQ